MQYIARAALLLAAALLFGATLSGQQVNLDGPTAMGWCEQGTFTLEFAAPDTQTASSIVVTNTMPNEHFSYVGGSTELLLHDGTLLTQDPVEDGEELIWEVDDLLAQDYELPPGEHLSVVFDLRTACDAVSGTNTARVEFIAAETVNEVSDSMSIELLPGAVSISKLPSEIDARVGDVVTWTITVESTGLGPIKNVVVTDILGSGLAYHSSTPAADVDGQSVIWDSSTESALEEMAPDESVELELQAEVIACEGLGNMADVRFGCEDEVCFDTAVDGGTARASIRLILENPLLTFTPPQIQLPYCSPDGVTVDMPVTNEGEGPARNIRICVDFFPLEVTDVAGDASYEDGCFHLPDMEANESFDLTFTLEYPYDWCDGGPSGELYYQAIYENVCGKEFRPPEDLGTYTTDYGPAGPPSVSASIVGPSVTHIGNKETYDVSAAFSGLAECGVDGTTSDVDVTVDVPDGFEVEDAGGGTWQPGPDGTGGAIHWTFPYDEQLNTEIELAVPGTDYCFTTATTWIDATATDCCGCELSASGSTTAAIECAELVDSDKQAQPSAIESCTDTTYTTTYNFAQAADVDMALMSLDAVEDIMFGDLVFTEYADNAQEYVEDSLEITIDGNVVDSYVIVDNTPAGTLEISNINGAWGETSVEGRTLTFEYELRATPDSLPDTCPGTHTFFSWSSLDLGPNCDPDVFGECEKFEVTQVTISTPSMSVDVSGLPTFVDPCGTYEIEVILTKTSDYDPRNVRLQLEHLNYYIVDLGSIECSGVSPNDCTSPADLGDAYEWDYGDAFVGEPLGAQSALTFEVRKRCLEPGVVLSANAYYEDACGAECLASGSDSPSRQRQPDIFVVKTPEEIYATRNEVSWTIYVVNSGSGWAYEVWVDDILGDGLEYVSSTVSPGTGVEIYPNQDHEGFSINGVSWYIPDIPPGGSREITLVARMVSCTELDNKVQTGFACGDVECMVPESDDSTIDIPTSRVVSTSWTESRINICEQVPATIRIRNAGDPAVYNAEVRESLPEGMTYVPGTTEWRVDDGPWSPGEDPTESGFTLIWTKDEVEGLQEILSGEILEIRFDLQALCDFTGGTLQVETEYENVCGDLKSSPVGTFSVDANEPELTVQKSQIEPSAGNPIDCGGEVRWRIDVTNTGNATAEYVWVEDTLGDGFTYVSSEGDGVYSVDDGCSDGQMVTWALVELPPGTTATLHLTAQESDCGELTNTVEAWWGCGQSGGTSCTMDATCLTDISVSDETTGTRTPTVRLTSALDPAQIEACGEATFTLSIENTSTATASAIDAQVTLPVGLSYVDGSTEIDCGTGFVQGDDPAITDQTLLWFDENDPGTNLCAEIPPGETIRVRFTVRAACYLSPGDAEINVWYHDCCFEDQLSLTDSREIQERLPRLEITKTPDSVALDCHDPGDTVTWTITVTNTGDATADWVTIEDELGAYLVYEGSSPEASPAGGGTWTWELGPLAPDESHTVELTARLDPPPDDCSLAPRTNTARATWGCEDPDTGVTCASGLWVQDTAIVTVPDLTLSSTDIEPQVVCIEDGNYVGRVGLTIHNLGDADVTEDFRLRVEESATGWSVEGYFEEDFGGTLPIVDSRQIWIEDVPLTCDVCDYTFTVTLDLDDDICECNEANNVGTRSWTMTLPDLRVADEDLTLSCASDGEVQISGTVTLANDGCGEPLTADVPMRFTLYDRQGCGGEEIHQWTQVFTGVDLAAGGGTQEFTIAPQVITVNLCEEAIDCGVSLFIEADYDDDICECSDMHNNLCVDFAVDIPSLTVHGEALELSCVDDGEVAISGSVTLRNDGCGSPLTTDVPMQFTLFGGPGCGGEILDEWTETFTGVDLAAGGGTQVFPITTRTSTQNLCVIGCEVWLLIEADYDDSICECDGTDNTRCVTLPVDIPDLVVTAVVPDVPDSCSTGTVDVTVRNIGCVGVELGIPVRITGDATGEVLLPALAPDGEVTVTIPLNEVLPCGSYSVTATVDPDDELCECSSVDNALDTGFDVVDPDLAVLNLSAGCNVDGAFDVTAEIHNLGTQDAPPSVVRIYVNEALAHQEDLPGLAIDTHQLISFTSASLPCGEVHSFRVVVDEDNEICECDTTNNEATVTASCPCPALVTDKRVDRILRGAEEISVDGPIEPGDVITYLLEVTNVGDGWAYNVNLTDQLPEEFLYVVGSTEATWPLGSSTDDPTGGLGPNLAWPLDATLRGGETLTLTFDATVTSAIRQGLSYTNTMWATGEEGDGTPIPADSSDRVPEDDDPDDSSSVTLPTVVPALRVDKAITDVLRAGASIWPVSAVEPGDVIEYRFEIENIGTGTAHNVEFTDELPFGVEYDTTLGDGVYEVDDPAAAGSLGVEDGETGLVTADIGATIAGGGTLTADYRVRVTSDVSQGVDLVNVAAAAGEDGAGTPIPEFNPDVDDDFPDSDDTRIAVREPGLALEKAIVDVLRDGASIWPTPIVLWGDVIVYEVVIRNVGLGTAYNVDFTDELPEGLAYDASADGVYEIDEPSDTGNLDIPDGTTGTIHADISAQLAGGATLVATYRTLVLDDAVPGIDLINLARVTGEDGAGTPIPEFNDDVGDVFPDQDTTTIRLGAPALVTGKGIYCDPCDPDFACYCCQPEPLLVYRGMVVRFELTVHNVGYSAAYELNIEDVLPYGFRYVEGSTTIKWPGGELEGEDADPLGAPGPELWWATTVELHAGETLTLIFEALVTDDATLEEKLTNTMWASGVDDFGVPIPPDSSEFVPEDDDPTDSSQLVLMVHPPSGPNEGKAPQESNSATCSCPKEEG